MATDMLEKAIDIFRANGGQLRMSKAIRLGISHSMFYSLRDKGIIKQINRGIYRLADLPPINNPDYVVIGLQYPNAVICLVSALAYHDITTQIPSSISLAVKRESRPPARQYPPISVYRFSGPAFWAGIEQHQIDGVSIKIYNPEKTLADCFKYRNKIGMDVVLEALQLYRIRKQFNIEELLKYAKICRVENVMRPYLEMSV